MRYLENIKRAKELYRSYQPDDIGKNERIKAIQDHAIQVYEIKKENDAILHSEALGLFEDKENLNEIQINKLKEFVQAIEKISITADNGLCYQIHKKILEYDELHHDFDGIIKENYYIGLHLYYLNKIPNFYHQRLFNDEILKVNQYNASFLNDLDKINDPETQSYILRSYGNIKLGYDNNFGSNHDEYFHYDLEVMERDFHQRLEEGKFFSDKNNWKKVPQFNWELNSYMIHLGKMILLGHLRNPHFENNQAMIDAAYESANFIYQKEKEKADRNHTEILGRVQYFYQTARYHKHEISISELLNFLAEYLKKHQENTEDLYDSIVIPLAFLEYSSKEVSKDMEYERKEVQKKMVQMMLKMNPDKFSRTLGFYISEIMVLCTDKKQNMQEYLLSYLLSFHKPTYVHSLMVAILSKKMMERMVDVNAEYLVKHSKYTCVEDVKKDKEKLADQAYQCGIYHDIGKAMVIDYVSLYERSLFEEEYRIIQIHPYVGYNLLKQFETTKDYAFAALGHHRYYDESKGYPSYYKRSNDLNQTILDILTVCDCIDAACDTIGRSYSKGIRFEKMIEEIRELKGMNYCPAVVELFDDASFFKEIQEMLPIIREDIYDYVSLLKSSE